MTVFFVLIKRAGSADSGGRPSDMDVGVSAPLTGGGAPIPGLLPSVPAGLGADMVLAIRC